MYPVRLEVLTLELGYTTRLQSSPYMVKEKLDSDDISDKLNSSSKGRVERAFIGGWTDQLTPALPTTIFTIFPSNY